VNTVGRVALDKGLGNSDKKFEAAQGNSCL